MTRGQIWPKFPKLLRFMALFPSLVERDPESKFQLRYQNDRINGKGVLRAPARSQGRHCGIRSTNSDQLEGIYRVFASLSNTFVESKQNISYRPCLAHSVKTMIHISEQNWHWYAKLSPSHVLAYMLSTWQGSCESP